MHQVRLVWRKSETLRQDAVTVLASLHRNPAVAILGSAALLAGAARAAVIMHILTGRGDFPSLRSSATLARALSTGRLCRANTGLPKRTLRNRKRARQWAA